MSEAGKTTVNKSDIGPLISINERQVGKKTQEVTKRANMAKDEVRERPPQAVSLKSL